jgi:ABC-type antimicrobial peptide transport system permease subunit
MAKQLSDNPAELIDKHVMVSVFTPTKLYESVIVSMEVNEFGNSVRGEQIKTNKKFCKLVTIESTITGILPGSYNLQRESWVNFIFMPFGQLIDIVEQNKDMDIGERIPGFPEKELGPSALVIYADTYKDVAKVASQIEAISEDFSVTIYATNTEYIQGNFSDTKRVLTTVTVVFIGIVAALFGMLYYLKNRSRKREIGILKAIGFTKSNITALSFVEMLKMALPAFIISIVMALAFVPLGANVSTAYINSGFFSITPLSILVGFLVCIVVVLLSGIFPAYNASKVDPIEAIRKNHK